MPFDYVEVKGTRRKVPWFLISEGELCFAVEHDGRYLLAVVYGIDLEEQSHVGIVTAPQLSGLEPIQWSGILNASSVSSQR